MKKKSTFFILSFVLSLFFGVGASQAAEATPSTILVNGAEVTSPSFVQQGRTMVHSRFFEHTNVAVTWNNQSKSIVLKRNGMLLAFPSGKEYAETFDKGTGSWQREMLDVETVNQSGTTYIPLRYAAEALGLKVSYDPNQSLVSIGSPSKSSRSSQSSQDRELEWLYRITEAEAGGENYEGKLAVAATILNRVESPDWPNTIKDVIFQVTTKNGVNHYQFSPVSDKRIYKVTPSSDTIKAVQEALKGKDPTEGATVFYNPDKTFNQWVRSRPVTTTIGNHVFAN